MIVNVPALQAAIGIPYDMVQSTNGDLYIVSKTFHTVFKVEFNKQSGTSLVTVVAGTGSSGFTPQNDVSATENPLFNPMSVSLIENMSGEVTDLIIAEAGVQRIRKVNMASNTIKTIASGFNGPVHAYYDKSTGDIFIAQMFEHTITRLFTGNGTKVTVAGGGYSCPDPINLGDGGLAVDACLNGPTYFTMNSAGEWFIADSDNNRIRKVGLDGKISTVAGGGLSTGDALATAVKLTYPKNIAFAPSGDMLVADYQGERVRVMDESGFMRVVAGGGSLKTEDISAKETSIMPASLAYTTFGILIGDQGGFIRQLYVQCYGVKSIDDSVCSGHGSCIAPDNCTCTTYGWMGDDCSLPACFNIASNDAASVCSGHGSCIGIDQCECNDGWMGTDCSITHCFGITSNHPDVCSGNGQCIKHNECECDGAFRGHRCQRPPPRL